jgi:uncharacterized protein (TIGR02145 family)
VVRNESFNIAGGLPCSTLTKIKSFATATLVVATFSIFVGILTDSIQGVQANDGEIQIASLATSGSISLTINNSGPCGGFNYISSVLNIRTTAGSISNGCFTVITGTSSDYGYTLSLTGPSSGNLEAGNTGAIFAKSGSILSPSIFNPTTTGGEWGFAIPGLQTRGRNFGFNSSYDILSSSNQDNTALYAPVPTITTPISTTSAANHLTDDIYHVYVAVATGPLMATGEYSGTITVSVVANVALPQPPTITSVSPNTGSTAGGTTVTITGTNFMLDGTGIVDLVSIGASVCHSINVISNTSLTCITTAGSVGAQTVSISTDGGTAELPNGFTYVVIPPQNGDFLQTITAANCPTTRIWAIDARDNATYWVRRIPGTGTGGTDLCWMETNLAYTGGTANGGTNQFGDVTPALTQGITGTNTGAGQTCFGNNATMDDFKQRCYWIPTNANPTTAPTPPLTSTDGGATNPQFGYLYSWCAALNGQPAACQATAATQPNQSVNGGTPDTLHNICPLGWRLPTGQADTGEFVLLNNTINSGIISSAAGLLINGLFTHGGMFSNGAFTDIGIAGRYWSSTANTATNARRLIFNSPTTSTVVGLTSNASKGLGLSVRCVAP